jgi:hypothetical protein
MKKYQSIHCSYKKKREENEFELQENVLGLCTFYEDS